MYEIGESFEIRWSKAGSAQLFADLEQTARELAEAADATPFYALEGRLLQVRFLEQFLRGVDTGIMREPPIRLAIRDDGDRYHWRYEAEWPIARTVWTDHHLDAKRRSLSTAHPDEQTEVTYSAERGASGTSVTFSTVPFARQTEVTGPIALRLWVSSSGDDADLFAVVRNVAPNGDEITYPGPLPEGPRIAAAYGWLRASHRKLDPARSTPYRPYHTHDEIQKLTPGEPVRVEIEIWPTSVVFPPGHRLVLEVGSRDDARTTFQHSDPRDRVYGGTNTIHTGGRFDSSLLLPIVPPR